MLEHLHFPMLFSWQSYSVSNKAAREEHILARKWLGLRDYMLNITFEDVAGNPVLCPDTTVTGEQAVSPGKSK